MMQTLFRNKHFITLQDWTKEEIDTLLEVSYDLKKSFAMGIDTNYLQNKTIFLMFFEQSTRTRNSMEAGIAQLGGHANYLDTSTMQISHGEVAKIRQLFYLATGTPLPAATASGRSATNTLREMAEHSSVPVINMQCDLYHPLQAIADLMTMQEKMGELKRRKVSIIWAYATSHKKPISVPLSQALLFPRYGMDVWLAYPEGYEMPDWVIEQARANAEENGGTFTITNDMDEAYKDADIVIPKNWGSWVSDPEGKNSGLLEANRHWICTEDKIALGKKDVRYMHALPADRGNEVTDAVIDGPHSIVYDEAENRLHTSKALMTLTMGGR
jgi:ornithine carbamoyltransferase